MTDKQTHNEPNHQAQAPGQGRNAGPWAAGAFLLLSLAVAAGLYWGRTVTVQKISFEGNYFVTAEELEERVDIPLGVKPDSLDFASIISEVEEITYVREAEVRVAPGGDLVVYVTERQPLAMLADGENKAYVDAEGVKLPLALGKAVDVPVLYGFRVYPLGDTLKSDAFQSISRFLVEVDNKPVSDATISEIAWTESEGVVALTNDNGVKLLFGKDNYKLRLRNWEAFYAEVVRQKGMSSMRSVDLRFRGQIVTRES